MIWNQRIIKWTGEAGYHGTDLQLAYGGGKGWLRHVQTGLAAYAAAKMAVALNESALYLRSAIGAAIGGVAPSLPIWSLPLDTGFVAAVGMLVQFIGLRRSAG